MKWVRCEIKKNKSRYSLYIEESRWNTDDHNHNMAPTDKQQFQRTHKYTAESKWRLYRNNWVFCIRLLITMFTFDVKSYQRERDTNVKKHCHHSVLHFVQYSVVFFIYCCWFCRVFWFCLLLSVWNLFLCRIHVIFRCVIAQYVWLKVFKQMHTHLRDDCEYGQWRTHSYAQTDSHTHSRTYTHTYAGVVI